MAPRQISAASDGRFREYIPNNPFAGIGFLSLTRIYTCLFTLALKFLSCRVSTFYRVGMIYMLNACPAEIDSDISRKAFRKNYNVDPLLCPKYLGSMRIIAFK